MKRIITITRCVQHFVDIAIDDAETEAEARRRALDIAGTDHAYWDIEQKETPWVLAVRSDTASHVCGLSGYNPMIDPECPGCEARK